MAFSHLILLSLHLQFARKRLASEWNDTKDHHAIHCTNPIVTVTMCIEYISMSSRSRLAYRCASRHRPLLLRILFGFSFGGFLLFCLSLATRMSHTPQSVRRTSETKLFSVECKKCLAHRLVRVQIVFDINFKFDYGFANRCAKHCAVGRKVLRRWIHLSVEIRSINGNQLLGCYAPNKLELIAKRYLLQSIWLRS